MQRIDTELSIGFSKMVRDINTRNPYWKDYIKEIDYQMCRYLDNELYQGNIIQYDLEISRFGQSIIGCNLKYFVKYNSEPIVLIFKESVKTPREVCRSILNAGEIAVAEIVKRDSKYDVRNHNEMEL